MRDAVVVGAGPAGLAAAGLLGEHGADVVLLDEQAAPGGQLWRGVEAASAGLRAMLGAEYARGAAAIARFRASGAEYRPGSSVWQITPEREVWFSRAGSASRLAARAVILAPGAIERPVPLPGWTLTGVMSAGSVQILLKSAGMVADGLVLAGSGPLLLLLAAQCIAAGAPPAAILDTTSRANRRAAIFDLPAALRGYGLSYLAKGMMLGGLLRAHGIATHHDVTDLALDGTTQVEAVRFSSRGRHHRIATRLVALHEGVIPAQHITRSLGCAHVWDAAQASFRPRLDGWGSSSLPGILVAGDAGGIGGAAAATHGGRLAAAEVLHLLGRIDGGERDRLAGADRRAWQAHRAVRPFLDRRFAPPEGVLHPADGTVICRCEEVTAGQVRAAIAQGCVGPNQAKAFLRAGMGPCQGRLCGPTISSMFARETGGAHEHFRIRPPLKPISLGELAEVGGEGGGG